MGFLDSIGSFFGGGKDSDDEKVENIPEKIKDKVSDKAKAESDQRVKKLRDKGDRKKKKSKFSGIATEVIMADGESSSADRKLTAENDALNDIKSTVSDTQDILKRFDANISTSVKGKVTSIQSIGIPRIDTPIEDNSKKELPVVLKAESDPRILSAILDSLKNIGNILANSQKIEETNQQLKTDIARADKSKVNQTKRELETLMNQVQSEESAVQTVAVDPQETEKSAEDDSSRFPLGLLAAILAGGIGAIVSSLNGNTSIIGGALNYIYKALKLKDTAVKAVKGGVKAIGSATAKGAGKVWNAVKNSPTSSTSNTASKATTKATAGATTKAATSTAAKVGTKAATSAVSNVGTKSGRKAANKASRKATNKVGRKAATKAGRKVAKNLATKKAANAAVKTTAKKAATTATAKTVAKAGGKFLGRSALKKIPILGLVPAIYFALDRFTHGDKMGGVLELLSGASSLLHLIPGVGSAVGLALGAAIDSYIIARDLAGAGLFKLKLSPSTYKAMKKIAEFFSEMPWYHPLAFTGVRVMGQAFADFFNNFCAMDNAEDDLQEEARLLNAQDNQIAVQMKKMNELRKRMQSETNRQRKLQMQAEYNEMNSSLKKMMANREMIAKRGNSKARAAGLDNMVVPVNYTATSAATGSGKSGVIKGSNNTFDVGKAVAWSKTNVRGRGWSAAKGQCAKYVRLALTAGGAVSGGLGNGKDVANTLISRYGWKQVPEGGPYQAGDVASQTYSPYGHAAWFTGTEWVSDTWQGNSPKGRRKYPVKIVRHPGKFIAANANPSNTEGKGSAGDFHSPQSEPDVQIFDPNDISQVVANYEETSGDYNSIVPNGDMGSPIETPNIDIESMVKTRGVTTAADQAVTSTTSLSQPKLGVSKTKVTNPLSKITEPIPNEESSPVLAQSNRSNTQGKTSGPTIIRQGDINTRQGDTIYNDNRVINNNYTRDNAAAAELG